MCGNTPRSAKNENGNSGSAQAATAPHLPGLDQQATSGGKNSLNFHARCLIFIDKHRIERGEKNISFANLLKISGVLGVTISELLLGLEDSTWPDRERLIKSSKSKGADSSRALFEVQRLVKSLKLQRAAMDRTVELLEKRALAAQRTGPGGPRGASTKKRTPD